MAGIKGKLAERRIRKATTGSKAFRAGARRRRKLKRPKEKIGAVLREFKQGTLHSGSGEIVKSRKQAIAIALSEARRAGARIPKPKRK